MENSPTTESSSLHFLDYWRILRSRKEIFLVTMLLVVVTGSFLTFTQDPIYDATCKMRVEEDRANMAVFSQQSRSSYDPTFYYTEEEILKSPRILYEVIEKLSLRKEWGKRLLDDGGELSMEYAYRALQRSINIDQMRNTSILSITAESTDNAEAAKIANEIANAYREYRQTLSFNEVRRSLESMTNELVKQKEKVDLAEAELEKIRSEENLVMTGRDRTISNNKMEALESDLISYRIDMTSRKTRLEEVEKMPIETLREAVGILFNDPIINDLRKQLLDTELNLRLAEENLGPNHPDVVRSKAAVEQIQNTVLTALTGIKAGVRADYNMAAEKVKVLEGELAQLKAQTIIQSSGGVLRFSKAERQLRMERSIMDALQAKITQEQIDRQIPRTPVEIFQFAEASSRPVKPNVLLYIIVSVLIGIIIGVCLAFFIEYLDTSVKTVDDLEKYLALPVVGVIPQKVKPLIQEGPDSPNAEAYRVLRTNLQFSNKGVGGGAFAVVSAGVGEGKSTTLFNLAYICARMGDKVLIVDSDMRRPVQHTILGVSNRVGLTNVLMRDVPVEEAIKTTMEPNLHFLPSGKLPRNAVGLLDSQRVRDLIKSLKARYDYVFFDSPPIMGVSDASIIASEVDGVMLVVQYRKFPRALSARAKRLIENVGGNIVGVVLNNINIMRDDYYYYYQSYYSHYAHTDNVETPAESAKS